MSATLLSRERGTAVRCNGCGSTSVTGQIAIGLHREYLRTQSWGRGVNAGTKTVTSTKRHDLCPPCLAKDRALAKERKAKATAARAARDLARKLTPEQWRRAA